MARAADPQGETFGFVPAAGLAAGAKSMVRARRPGKSQVEAFITSLGLVAVAEIGDKTQLLAFVLAARFRGRAAEIIAGIFVATVANHLCAAWIGGWGATRIDAGIVRWILGLSFLAFAVWALVPDWLDEEPRPVSRYGAFVTTLVVFFIAEIGDKTQLATIALGAQYQSVLAVTLGTTLGMMVANVPAVLIGKQLSRRFPLAKMRFVAAALFALFGLLILFGVGG
jgi:Ca2+/H+ antiporter, TMEM165/GDT1 family